MAGVGTGGTLPDQISTMVTEVLSEIKGGALVPLKSTGVRWVKSCLIFEVTTGASNVEV